MTKKITVGLFLMAFSLSTFLSIGGVIPLIADYFKVPLSMAGLFVALFALILSITGLILPSYFSKYGRKRFFMISILVFLLSSFCRFSSATSTLHFSSGYCLHSSTHQR